jgi:7-cyano-7-deazaguanine synthase
VLLSGGIDSATCLYATKEKYGIRALTLEYDGIAQSEIQSAKKVANGLGVRDHRIVRLPDLREAGDIVEGRFGSLPSTYIPMRNIIFYSFASSFAEEARASIIVGGHNLDDTKIFRDVSDEFFQLLEKTIWSGSEILGRSKTRIVRPLRRKTKAQVVKYAASLGVPFKLTWSCHRDGKEHCWDCDGCRSRLEAFRRAGVPDPLAPVLKGKIT